MVLPKNMQKYSELSYEDAEHLYNVLEVCEKCGWGVFCNEDNILLRNHSPLGEDISFEISLDFPCSDIAIEYENFDVDYHVKTLIAYSGRNGIPNDIQALVDDAKDIEKMLEELTDAVEKVY